MYVKVKRSRNTAGTPESVQKKEHFNPTTRRLAMRQYQKGSTKVERTSGVE